MALLKITDTALIGNSTPIGLFLLAYVNSVLYYFATLVTTMQCNLALKSMGNSGSALDGVRRVMKFMIPNTFVNAGIISICVVLDVALARGQGMAKKNLNQYLFMICMGWRGLNMIIAVYQVTAMRNAVDTAFDGVESEDGKIFEVKKVMSELVKTNFKSASINATLMFTIVIYQPLHANFSYVLMLQYCMMQLALLKTIKMFDGGKGKKSGKVVDSSLEMSLIAYFSKERRFALPLSSSSRLKCRRDCFL